VTGPVLARPASQDRHRPGSRRDRPERAAEPAVIRVPRPRASMARGAALMLLARQAGQPLVSGHGRISG
jgi:hypothetical protein